MFLARQPAPTQLDRILDVARGLPLSYAQAGLARLESPPGYRVAEERAVIGHGVEAFDAAVSALRAWRQFDLGWTRIYPPDAPLVPGTTVLVVARHLGFWSVNACRILYTLSPQGSEVATSGSEVVAAGSEVAGSEVAGSEVARIAGFAYGTLTEHAETGEEIFQVTFDEASGRVTYLIRAVSRESALLAKLGFPFARALQARFRSDSAVAMRQAVALSAP